ncbi:hypothetical protein [Streptomyces sp. NWU339]|uniref:hypothetical protein n=1 Tax=Streptomyces sp. NWU339 TaxID=2185284 RepID=UPI0015E7F036|nr:hypothetical protein [Streptomyces sp. NWU339]
MSGSVKGDGAYELLRPFRFRASASIGIYLRGSRDRRADLYLISQAADVLRSAGHRVTVEIDEARRRAFAEGEEDRAERARRVLRGAGRALPDVVGREAGARAPRSDSRLRASWVARAAVGWAVTPRTWTVRMPTSMTKKTYSRVRVTVSTWEKSTARSPLAWARRKSRQVGASPDRRGAGSRPAERRTRRMVAAPTR